MAQAWEWQMGTMPMLCCTVLGPHLTDLHLESSESTLFYHLACQVKCVFENRSRAQPLRQCRCSVPQVSTCSSHGLVPWSPVLGTRINIQLALGTEALTKAWYTARSHISATVIPNTANPWATCHPYSHLYLARHSHRFLSCPSSERDTLLDTKARSELVTFSGANWPSRVMAQSSKTHRQPWPHSLL